MLAEEPGAAAVRALVRDDDAIAAWWGARVECASAVARWEREGRVGAAWASHALRRLDGIAADWHEVQPVERVRHDATRLLRVHPLRAADAFQLAAAVVASGGHASSLPFVTLDRRLADAARREGFPVLEPGA